MVSRTASCRADRSGASSMTSACARSCSSRSAWPGRISTAIASSGKTRFAAVLFWPKPDRKSRGGGSAGIALRQQRVESARGLAFAALRPCRFGRRRPAIDVEVEPRLRPADEAAEKQRGRDRAALAARRYVVDVGGLRLEHGFVGAPQRHAPQRIVLGGGTARESGGQRLIIGIERRPIGTESDSRGAGERRHVDDELGRTLVGQRQRIAENQARSE